MPSSKKRPKRSRRSSDERAEPPAPQRVHGTFVVEEGLTLADVFDPNDRLGVVIDIDRRDTAAESVQVFVTMLQGLHDSFERRRGMRRTGAVLRMADVGVVLRNKDGVRVWAPEGESPLPTLYARIQDGAMFASFGPNVVARARQQEVDW
tara:strand:- start:48 stop:497 length:450 start_codon:yes stop_codon:yes gene_type:complete